MERFTLDKAARGLGILVSVCMDCREVYGRPKDAQGAEGGVSHGICEPCGRKREESDRQIRMEWAELSGEGER